MPMLAIPLSFLGLAFPRVSRPTTSNNPVGTSGASVSALGSQQVHSGALDTHKFTRGPLHECEPPDIRGEEFSVT
jgi:hypothetical protein